MFVKRVKPPVATDNNDLKYYTSDKRTICDIKGVNNFAIKNDSWNGSTLANCTAYCFGRVCEIYDELTAEQIDRLLFGENHITRNARDWWNLCKDSEYFVKSQIPSAPSIVVFDDGKLGHVEFVEEVGKNAMTTTASASSDFNANLYWVLRNITLTTSTYKGKYGNGQVGYKYGSNVKMRYSNYTLTYKGFKVLGYITLPKAKTSVEALKVGDKVQIIANGNSKTDGNGKTSKGIGWTRYILGVTNGAYPYKVGSSKGVLTGYYKANALKKI